MIFLFQPIFCSTLQETLLNIAQLASTWLTVNIAIGRYFAICRPLHAKGFISIKGIRMAILSIFLLSILFNIPKLFFLFYENQDCHQMLYEGGVFETKPTPSTTQHPFLFEHALPDYSTVKPTSLLGDKKSHLDYLNQDLMQSNKHKTNKHKVTYTYQMDHECGCQFTIKRITKINKSSILSISYMILTSIFYIFLPLVILSVCNICLIIALRKSYRMQRLYRANKSNKDNGQRITTALIVVIMFFIVLVIPPDLIIFTKNFVSSSFLLINVRVTNLLLLTNFSFNFILYCVINTKFRSSLKALLTCQWFSKSSRERCTDSYSQTTASNTFAQIHKISSSEERPKTTKFSSMMRMKNMKIGKTTGHLKNKNNKNKNRMKFNVNTVNSNIQSDHIHQCNLPCPQSICHQSYIHKTPSNDRYK